MDVELLKTFGQIAGIGGLALGVFLLLFRDIIAKNIFPQLAKKDAYRLLRLISVLIFLIAAFGLAAWVWIESSATIVIGNQIETDCGVVNTGTTEGATITIDCEKNADSR